MRDALRSFHDPVSLAASPLAVGSTTRERAESVRMLLRRAAEEAFGESDSERLQRSTITLGYLDPAGGHTRAMRDLRVSRATYFRRLATASARVDAYVARELPGAAGSDPSAGG